MAINTSLVTNTSLTINLWLALYFLIEVEVLNDFSSSFTFYSLVVAEGHMQTELGVDYSTKREDIFDVKVFGAIYWWRFGQCPWPLSNPAPDLQSTNAMWYFLQNLQNNIYKFTLNAAQITSFVWRSLHFKMNEKTGHYFKIDHWIFEFALIKTIT